MQGTGFLAGKTNKTSHSYSLPTYIKEATCHGKARNSASLAKPRSFAVITVAPIRAALIRISAPLARRSCPIFS
jgi:hypothetical protein